MRLSRKMTEYGKELYNWNFFKVGKGYKINPNAKWSDTTKRVGFGLFNNEPNTTLSEKVSDLIIYITRADTFTLSQWMPCYYNYTSTSSKSMVWPNESRAKNQPLDIRDDYDKIANNYIYKIKIENNKNLMIVGNRTVTPESFVPQPVSAINLSPGFYKIFVCTMERFDTVSFGCWLGLDGWYYSVYANTIFVDAGTNTIDCFRSYNSGLQDYELQMLSDSNEIQEIPSYEMVVYDKLTDQINYNGKTRLTLDNGDDVWVVGARTKVNETWYYAYNTYKKIDPTPKGILGGNNNTDIRENNTNENRKSKLDDFFIEWFTITVTNINAPFSVEVKLNDQQYQFINSIRYNDLCHRMDGGDPGEDVSPAFTELNPYIYHEDSHYSFYRNCFCTFKENNANIELPNYSKWLRNELIPVSYSNCTISLHNNIFYNHATQDYDEEKTYEAVNYDWSKISGLIGDEPEYKTKCGCFLMFQYFTSYDKTNDIKVYIMVDNPQRNIQVAGLEASNYVVNKNGFKMDGHNGKIEEDYIYSPVNYQLVGEQNLPPYTTPTNNQNGGN